MLYNLHCILKCSSKERYLVHLEILRFFFLWSGSGNQRGSQLNSQGRRGVGRGGKGGSHRRVKVGWKGEGGASHDSVCICKSIDWRWRDSGGGSESSAGGQRGQRPWARSCFCLLQKLLVEVVRRLPMYTLERGERATLINQSSKRLSFFSLAW